MHDRSMEQLNRAFATLYRSFPAYLVQSHPWMANPNDKAGQTLRAIVADQQRSLERLAQLIQDRRGAIETDGFPMEFTDTQMLSLDFLLGELIHYQRQDIDTLEQCAIRLANDRPAREIVEESLGAEKAHLEALCELQKAAVA